MSLSDKTVLITGASMGIGRSMALRLAQENPAHLILLSRSHDKLETIRDEIKAQNLAATPNVIIAAIDIQDQKAVNEAIEKTVNETGQPIDILINNAGLALGTPNIFSDLKIPDINTMIGTNISGLLYTTHAVLNAGKMLSRSHGTILNITSTTALEAPPFPGEAIYHASKAFQEGFTNSLRNELSSTSIRVLALRPGVVATHFHEQRVGFDKGMYDGFMEGFEPLVADDVAEAAAWMLGQGERVSVKALDVVPTAQRSLAVFDRGWVERQGEAMKD
ncbi:NADP-dependent L-serine/L-allo-threonine dehydrogenase ydfG [Dendryphion nanum]|uniref:NADP-dependent L-serine/L-allo-threonine dehydrogenase ydfG n=1 Tax=Dendryphion nanum TaxID=256645 RepID=A0A9P9EJ81_9PLEO|nr:NADP-dependent L-serine/L-allo-threonine dehydrogenase ydfG [Dendryphion nanum]